MTEKKRIAKGLLEQRAQAAFLLSGLPGSTPDEIKSTYTMRIGKLQYVVLDGATRRLAVYRIRTYDGFLRLLRRWPKELQFFDPHERRKSTETFFDPGNSSVVVDDPFDAPTLVHKENDLPPWRISRGTGGSYVPLDRQGL